MLAKASSAGPVAFSLLMAGSILMAADQYRVLFNFSDAESSQKWQTVNDGVMRGVSDGQFKISSQTMEFFGTLSLVNAIGFLLSDKQGGPFKLEIEWIRVIPTVEAANGNVSCEGVYPHHLQGICVGDTAIYWSFTTQLVKTDLRGKLLGKLPVANHHGDLCFHDGKVYVAVNLGKFNDPAGNADSWVYVYAAKDLSLITKHETQEVFRGSP